jgi:hypothetical protein
MYCICWQQCSFNMKVSCQSTQSHTAMLVIACWAGRSLPMGSSGHCCCTSCCCCHSHEVLTC